MFRLPCTCLSLRAAVLLCAAVGLAAPAAQTESFSATVTAVTAGDVYTVDRGGQTETVVLYGADCPDPGQGFAAEAKTFATDNLLKQTVTFDERARDAAGRAVVSVVLPDGGSLAEELAGAGLAWWDDANAPDAKEVKKRMAGAIAGGTGLWSDAAALAPADYRKSHGMPALSYRAAAPEPSASKPAEEKPKELMLKGKEDASGEALASPLAQALPPGLQIPEGVDVNGLLQKHNPRIATGADGKPIGLAVDNINDIPFAAQFGFQEGDIIAGVNGMPIRDMSDILLLAGAYQGEKNFTVDVVRGGSPIQVTVDVP